MPLLDLQKENHNVMNNQKEIFSPTNEVPEIFTSNLLDYTILANAVNFFRGSCNYIAWWLKD
jgi:hypothetical protein